MELPYIQVFFLHSCPSLLKSCHTLQVFLAREIPESKGMEKSKPIHWLSVPFPSEEPDLNDLTLIPLLTWAPKASIPLCPMGSLCAMPSPSLMGCALSCPAIASPILRPCPDLFFHCQQKSHVFPALSHPHRHSFVCFLQIICPTTDPLPTSESVLSRRGFKFKPIATDEVRSFRDSVELYFTGISQFQ